MKEATQRDYHERINKVLHYINAHLDEKMELEKLASLSNFSPFHFHRIMRAHLNESLGSYILRARLDTAARLLEFTGMSVSDIAYKVGYDVPSSFTKAFKKRFDVSPMEFKNDGLKTINYLEQVKTAREMELKVRIVEAKPRKVVYVQSIGEYSGTGTAEAWQEVFNFVKSKRLFSWRMEMIGVSHDDPQITEADKCRYDACITVSREVKPEGKVGVKTLEGGPYAVFRYQGPYSGLGEAYSYIYRTWLPGSGKELRDHPCFEKYLNDPNKVRPEKLLTEIHVPVK
jgi:AraC family transcriptional regulator